MRRVVAVLVDGPETGYASVDPDLAGAAGLGTYDATMTLLRAAAAGRRAVRDDSRAGDERPGRSVA